MSWLMAFLSEQEASIWRIWISKCWSNDRVHQDTRAHPKQPSAQPLTAMNSALELTNCLKQSKKFSSVGRIWASLTEKWQENGSGESTRWLLDMPREGSCRLSGELFVSNIPQMDNPDINNKELQPQRPGSAQLRNTHKNLVFYVFTCS